MHPLAPRVVASEDQGDLVVVARQVVLGKQVHDQCRTGHVADLGVALAPRGTIHQPVEAASLAPRHVVMGKPLLGDLLLPVQLTDHHLVQLAQQFGLSHRLRHADPSLGDTYLRLRRLRQRRLICEPCQASAHAGPADRVAVMAHSFDTDSEASGLCAFVDASPSPFHACAEAGARLAAAGFSLLAEVDAFPAERGRYYMIRGGSLIAWSSEAANGPATPFRVVGAHTDSPNLRIKPQPDLSRAGWQLLGIESYGGPLFNSWLDRDLGLSGRVAVRSDDGVQTRLVTIDEPGLRVAQLAVHLDRGANEALALNPQQHLTPLWGVSTEPGDFRGYLAAAVGADAADVLSWDVMTHDLQPSRRIGRDLDLIAAPRLDNLATSYAGVRALIEATGAMASDRTLGGSGLSS